MYTIPFSYLTRKQVAELLNRHPQTIDKYTKEGKNVDGKTIILKKHKGRFNTEDVLNFKKAISR